MHAQSVIFFVILEPFQTKNEKKTVAMLQVGINVMQLFFFLCIFVLFSQEVLQNGQKGSKNGQNTTFFYPWLPNYAI